MQKTNKPQKGAETNRTESNFLVRFGFGLDFLKPKYFGFSFGAGFFHLETDQTDRFIYIYIYIYVSLKYIRGSSLVENRARVSHQFTVRAFAYPF